MQIQGAGTQHDSQKQFLMVTEALFEQISKSLIAMNIIKYIYM